VSSKAYRLGLRSGVPPIPKGGLLPSNGES
jgi:hypothetical protein